ncbi:DMT family transporter [Marinobacter nanhaiticus D15-8W]|uniref:DMT family transporter n=1 Tax=Marinobacter nanhaiticus D15-8W TaxID=626887 RepID=N6WNM6_9GAMM|nr:DMT family transporter [Marinobacter nanhaiticus D15-8W]BES70478.1 DMT family transporter [Marinobacter nanhaiticus D15-8W]
MSGFENNNNQFEENNNLRRTGVSDSGALRIVVLTTLAMLAFAANSVLGRMALDTGNIDAASFTFIRLVSGAAMLWGLVWIRVGRPSSEDRGSWFSGAMLFLYAICFSYAYLSLDTGTGALILFGLVQLTMIGWGLVKGERPSVLQWTGTVMAVGGLVYLLSPGVTAPSLTGALLMALAGVAWGVYSLRGRGVSQPLVVSSDNFLRSVPMALVALLLAIPMWEVDLHGVVLAMLSGAVASAIGYAIWYTALSGLTATRAASVQLSVPVIAAAFGVALLAEPVTVRLVVSAVIILGGIALVILSRRPAPAATTPAR